MLLKERLVKLLTQQGSVTTSALEKVVAMHKNGEGTLSDLIVREHLISESDLSMLLGTELNLPVLNLNLFSVEPEVIRLIPRKWAMRCEVVPVAKIGKILTLAMADPLNVLALDEIQEITRCAVRPIICTSKVLHNALDKYYSDMQEIDTLIEEADEEMQIIHDTESADDIEAHEASFHDAPVIKMVDLILSEGIKHRASDIHLEPYEQTFQVRYRVDGDLIEAYKPPRKMHGSMMTRLKILSGMDITEHRKPQDGRFKVKISGKEIDFRASVLPMIHGEKCVLRILDRASIKVSMGELGILPEPLAALTRATTKPYGMVIITGPTGSGKSTTLYSIMNRLNTPERNIMTIEDPVEYQVEGITQMQVATDIGLTFSDGLRSLLRQSPDVILIGEIRDNETADIAAKAALTGHLVFSTLHTNSAAGAITRLLDMKVEPFLIASSIILLCAQRLCRRLCEHCKVERPIPERVLTRLHVDPNTIKNIKSFYGEGCDRCDKTGFHGRLATLEVLEPNDEIRRLIIERKSSVDIQAAAERNGMKLLFENAFEKFKMGLTTLEEVYRIATL